MSETLKERTASSAPPSPYLFKDYLDAALYLIAYLVLPLYSVVDYINRSDAAILFTALSCCFGVIYDCRSRYDNDCGRHKAIKIWIIGIANAILFAYTIYSIQSYLSKNVLLCPYIYGFLGVAPVFGIIDLMLMARDNLKVRR